MRQPAGDSSSKHSHPSIPSVGPIKLMPATVFAKIAPEASLPVAGR
jgi:hypothetical protein